MLNKKEKADLIKSLRDLNITDDEIVKALDIASDKDDDKEEKSEDEETEEKSVKKSMKKSMKKAEDDDEEKSEDDDMDDKSEDDDEEKSEDDEVEEKSMKKSIKKSMKKGEDDEKTIDEKIADKAEELKELQEMKKSMKKSFFDNDIIKSFSDDIKSSTGDLNRKFDGLVTLVKSLAENVVTLKDDNQRIIKENDLLQKSLQESTGILNKLANFTPGLRSVKSSNFVDRFEKSETGKDIMSVTANKEQLSSILSKKMDESTFAKSYGNDVASFECSGRLTPQLEKAISDELGIKLVQ